MSDTGATEAFTEAVVKEIAQRHAMSPTPESLARWGASIIEDFENDERTPADTAEAVIERYFAFPEDGS